MAWDRYIIYISPSRQVVSPYHSRINRFFYRHSAEGTEAERNAKLNKLYISARVHYYRDKGVGRICFSYRFLYLRKGRGEGVEIFESKSDESTFTTTGDDILIKNVEYPRTERRDRSKGQRGDLRRWNERICQMNLNLKQLLNCKMAGHTIAMFNASQYLN